MRRIACLLVLTLLAAAAARAGKEGEAAAEDRAECRWSYTGPTGPDRWADICSPEYALCRVGQRQSPIDLRDARPADLPALAFDYRPTRFSLREAYFGNELQAHPPGERDKWIQLRVGSERFETYRLVQFHFHTPSEHQVEGRSSEMELHLVHENEVGELAAVGVLLREGPANAAFQAFVDAMPEPGRPGGTIEIDPLALLPARRGYFRYAGSLTTPGCSEGVRWHVLTEPITVSEGQITRFRARFPRTARPPQTRDPATRPLLRSRD